MALTGGDFALYKPFTCKINVVSSMYAQQMRAHHLLSFLHGLKCLNLCFNCKLLPIPCSRSTFKLAIVYLLAGHVSINPGLATSRNMRFATTNVCSVQGKMA